MAAILVFCGSATGQNSVYADAAKKLGQFIGNQGHSLITGGGAVGLMGVVANAALDAGAEVTGIIPSFLEDREVGHKGLSNLVLVKDMHERKAMMYDKCDLAIVLPGGLGTMDECFEFLCWSRLRLHKKPLGVLNVAGIYDHLEALVAKMSQEGFIGTPNTYELCIEKDLEGLLKALEI